MDSLETQIALAVFKWLTTFFNDKSRMPTQQELEDHLEADEDKYIAIGDEWLKNHPDDEEKE